MAGWLRYLIERSPPAALSVVAAGIAFSGIWIGGGRFEARGFVLVFAGLVLFMVLARLADELKDYEKDMVAHPERPLPRGLVTPTAVRRVMLALFAAMGVHAAVLGVAAGWWAGTLYAAAGMWLGLMAREFFARRALSRRPLVSAVLHQLVLIPLYGFAIAVWEPELALGPSGLAYAVANLGASMGYEIGRKLDVNAHPALGYYVAWHGPRRCAATIVSFMLIAAVGAWQLGAWTVLWPAEALVLATLPMFLMRPDLHRAVRGAAGLSVLVHIWSIPILRAVQWLA